MRILITGGSGFIGRPVIQRLIDDNHSVLALSRSASELEKENISGNIQWINSSLQLEEETVAFLKAFQPEIVIHLAWEKIPDFSFEISFQNLQNHILFFNSIYKISSLKKVIVAGSCFEYNQKFGKCLESDECLSTNYFTWAKNALRDFLRFECMQRKITFAWVRIFYVYGPKQRSGSLIPTIIEELLNGKTPGLKKPANANDFIYVDDVAEGFRKLIDKEIPSGIYNFGNGKSTEVIEVLKIAEKIIKKDDTITNEILNKAAKINKEIDFWADMTKTQSNLDWQPRTSIEEGIKRTINSFLPTVK